MNTTVLLMTLTNQFYKAVGFCGYHLFYKQCLQHFERQIRMENGIETCIIFYKKRNASPGSMQDTGCLDNINLAIIFTQTGLGSLEIPHSL